MTLLSKHSQEQEKKLDKEIDDFLESDYFNDQWEEQYLKLKVRLKSFIQNDREELLKKVVDEIGRELMDGDLRDSLERYFPKDEEARMGIRPSKSNRSGVLAYHSDIQAYLKSLLE